MVLINNFKTDGAWFIEHLNVVRDALHLPPLGYAVLARTNRPLVGDDGPRGLKHY